MRIRSMNRPSEDPINMTPMIDMVFLLLIFFLVATTFATEECDLAVQLPSTSASQALSSPPRQLIINIRQDGQVLIASQAYGERELVAFLADALRNTPNKEVLIRADKRSLFQYYANVVSICRKTGVKESKLGYLEEAPEPVAVE